MPRWDRPGFLREGYLGENGVGATEGQSKDDLVLPLSSDDWMHPLQFTGTYPGIEPNGINNADYDYTNVSSVALDLENQSFDQLSDGSISDGELVIDKIAVRNALSDGMALVPDEDALKDGEVLYDGNVRPAKEWKRMVNDLDEEAFVRKVYADSTEDSLRTVEKHWHTYIYFLIKIPSRLSTCLLTSKGSAQKFWARSPWRRPIGISRLGWSTVFSTGSSARRARRADLGRASEKGVPSLRYGALSGLYLSAQPGRRSTHLSNLKKCGT